MPCKMANNKYGLFEINEGLFALLSFSKKIKLKNSKESLPEKRVVVCNASNVKSEKITATTMMINSRRIKIINAFLGFIIVLWVLIGMVHQKIFPGFRISFG